MKTYHITTLPGDGIGPEIMAQAKRVLAKIGEHTGVDFVCHDELIGGAAIDWTREHGQEPTALPAQTLESARTSDAVLLAAVGGPKWTDTTPGAVRPEQGLLAIRKELGLYLNLRPVRVYASLAAASSLKSELLENVDILIVRELTGGLYFGAHEREEREVAGTICTQATDSMVYADFEIERVVRWAYEAAAKRRGHLTSVDKANVLETSRLWREVTHKLAAHYPDVTAEDMLVDNAAMQLIARPAQFDVLVTENTFGDILSDEASMLTGSLGMLASASLGDGVALYEPSHGSAPDIAGQGIANPIAQILSVELMLRYSFNMDEAADTLATAVNSVLEQGFRTHDIKDATTASDHVLTCEQMGDKILEAYDHCSA
ncbi:MAG: 3-isopropylmalate dehydrogenase [Atopobiaceae bacterium]|jgi:3-isopropylmalate dehydrogenase